MKRGFLQDAEDINYRRKNGISSEKNNLLVKKITFIAM